MPALLVVHHTPSPALQEMFEAAVSGARAEEIEGVQVVIRPALTAAAADVLGAGGYLLGTPANIGYMSGALKHFFDGIYYPCLEATRRRPYGLYVHGGMDTGGARDAALRTAELFLQHRLFRLLATGQVIRREWLTLHYPPYWHYDILQALLVLSRMRLTGDPRCADALAVLQHRRRPDGRWQPGAYWWKPPGAPHGTAEAVDWGRSAGSVSGRSHRRAAP
jgi:hypothetical protein